ncbi:unnamed protein product [Cercopithifilaria johnstoni]|uniref:Uncharacterized protein n=1 Tax=Cercopithifilaria johnstoni TaxID=2874296 RepID=A0A8J2Q3Y9_9BILA|nr:unnamed protein product [Cercopithifilaria johnstoni]
MSETLDDTTVTTVTATTNKTEEHLSSSSSSSYHIASNSVQYSSDASSPDREVMDNEKDHVSSHKEKLSNETKKQAMGDICSRDDPTKSIVESTTVSHIVNDNVSNQQLSKPLKTDTKSIETKKMQTTRQPDEGRRRSGGVFYAAHNRRGVISSGSRFRPTTYTARDYWRPHSTTDGYNNNNLRRSTPSTTINQTINTTVTTGTTISISNTGNTNQHRAITESAKNMNSHANTFSHRSQVIRTFHNGALRANRTWRGNNVARNSRNNAVVPSGFNSQIITVSKLNSESALNGSCSSGGVSGSGGSGSGGDGSRTYTGDMCYSSSNTISIQKRGKLPIIYVAPTGTISILLNKGVTIEVAVDRAVRVLCHDKFSAVCNSRGTSSCILHKKARIFQQNEKVFCNFVTGNDKAAVFGTQGILFTMSHLGEAYLVSSTIVKCALSVSLGRLQFPSLNYDFTVRMFFTESQNGDQFTELCNEIVQEARYEKRGDGTLILSINGVYIKQDERGDIEVNCRPKHISCSPTDGIVHIRTNMVDMAVQEDDKAFVKRGLKRVHVSRSGMVVSDGNCITSMDHLGNIVSST